MNLRNITLTEMEIEMNMEMHMEMNMETRLKWVLVHETCKYWSGARTEVELDLSLNFLLFSFFLGTI